MVFGKTGKMITIKPDEALEEALCFGWIDGQIKSIDDEKYMKKFTPRRGKSVWSDRNKGLANILIETGRITESGMRAIERAKAKGCWDTPKSEPFSEKQIQILVKAISGDEQALTNFLRMPQSAQKTYTQLYLDAKKEETKKNRLEHIIQRLHDNKKPMEK